MANKVTVAELLVEIGVDAKDAEKAAARLKDKLNKVGKAGERADKGVTKSEKALKRFAKAGKLANRVANGLGAALVGAAGAVAAIGKSVLTTGARFETLKIQLKTTTGSAEEADKAFKFIKDFAKNTPFQVDQITGAFVKLNNFGIEPTGRTMTAFGDFASAMGRSLDQMVEAVTDATVGEFERLKEFGIKTDARGEKIKFTFRGVTTEVEKNSEAIKGHLEGLAEQNFGGAMADQMGTAGGMVSNLMDAWAEFLNTVANLGPLEEFKGLIRDLQKAAGDNQGGLAKLLADVLVKAIKAVRSLLQGNLMPTLEKVVKILGFIIDNFGILASLFAGAKFASGVSAAVSGLNAMGVAATGALGPIGAIIAALGILIPIALEAGNALGDVLAKESGVARARGRGVKAGGVTTGALTSGEGLLATTAQRAASQRLLKAEATTEQLKASGASSFQIELAEQDVRSKQGALRKAQSRVADARKKQTEDQAKAKASSEQRRRNSALAEAGGLIRTSGITTLEQKRDIDIATEAIAGGADVEGALAAVSDAAVSREEATGFGIVGRRVGADTAAKRAEADRKRAEKEAKKRRPKSATTVSEFFAQAARGDLGPIADRTPSTREIEPTVAVDITNNNITMKADIKVEGVADPIAAAKSVAVQVRAEMGRAFAKAGQAMPSNMVR